MNDILKFLAFLTAIGTVSIAASIFLPSPDGGLFAYTILLSAMTVVLLVCSGLSEGRINSTADVMGFIEARNPLCLTIAAYVLGCSMIACSTVLLYRMLSAV